MAGSVTPGRTRRNHFDATTGKHAQRIWRQQVRKRKPKTGFTCSSFDLLHAGHILMLAEAKGYCQKLIVGLQSDPTLDRPEKNKPVQSLDERYIQLQAVKYIDEIYIYDTEQDLLDLLSNLKPDVRIVGADYIGKDFTGKDLGMPIVFNSRDHLFSTTELRQRVVVAEGKQDE